MICINFPGKPKTSNERRGMKLESSENLLIDDVKMNTDNNRGEFNCYYISSLTPGNFFSIKVLKITHLIYLSDL